MACEKKVFVVRGLFGIISEIVAHLFFFCFFFFVFYQFWSVKIIMEYLNVETALTYSSGLTSSPNLQIRQNDRLAVSKLVTSLTKGTVRSPFAQCLLIRYTAQVTFYGIKFLSYLNFLFLLKC